MSPYAMPIVLFVLLIFQHALFAFGGTTKRISGVGCNRKPCIFSFLFLFPLLKQEKLLALQGTYSPFPYFSGIQIIPLPGYPPVYGSFLLCFQSGQSTVPSSYWHSAITLRWVWSVAQQMSTDGSPMVIMSIWNSHDVVVCTSNWLIFNLVSEWIWR